MFCSIYHVESLCCDILEHCKRRVQQWHLNVLIHPEFWKGIWSSIAYSYILKIIEELKLVQKMKPQFSLEKRWYRLKPDKISCWKYIELWLLTGNSCPFEDLNQQSILEKKILQLQQSYSFREKFNLRKRVQQESILEYDCRVHALQAAYALIMVEMVTEHVRHKKMETIISDITWYHIFT